MDKTPEALAVLDQAITLNEDWPEGFYIRMRKARDAFAAEHEALVGLAAAYAKLDGAQVADGSWHSHAVASLADVEVLK